MIISIIPLSAGDEEANQYTTVVLTENKQYKVGNSVTIEIRFFSKDTPADPDDINITLGDAEFGSGRYIEVDKNDSKVETGVYRVTFTIEEGDDPWEMGAIYGEVRCTISSGRGEESDTADLIVVLEQEEEIILVTRVTADKPIFGEGETVRFTARFTYNGSYVDPEDPEAFFTVNGEDRQILLSRESEGVFYYDYVSPADDESKHCEFEARGIYNESYGSGIGEANRDHFQIWLNNENFTETRFEGRIGVCNLTGAAMELDVSVIYRYMNETYDEIVKQIDGTTGPDGLMNITLEFEDMGQFASLDITVWANESSRGGLHQYAQRALSPPMDRTPGPGFDIIPELDLFALSKNETYTLNYTAYENGTILAGKEIVYYFYTTPWHVSSGFNQDGEFGEVFLADSVTTDGNGKFSVTLTTPDRSTVIMDHFKADFGDSRGEGMYSQVMVRTLFIEMNRNDMADLGIEVDRIVQGELSTITVTGDQLDGGQGGVHLHVFDPVKLGIFDLDQKAIEKIVSDPNSAKEINRWLDMTQRPFTAQPIFDGAAFTFHVPIPEFFQSELSYLLFVGIHSDDGTQDGVDIISARLDNLDDTLGVQDDLLNELHYIRQGRGESLSSEEEVLATITVTANGSVVHDVNVTIEITGAGSSNISAGITDENGNLTFLLTAGNATNDSIQMTIYVNSSKAGYNNGTLNETITVKAYIPPKYLEIDTDAPDIIDTQDTVIVVATVTHNPPIEGADVTIETSGAGSSDISNGITDSKGQITFNITANNVTGENDHIFIWVNASKDGYEEGMYDRVITVIAYVEPKDMVITSDLPDNMDSEQIIPLEITVHDGDPLEGVTLTIQTSGPGHACKSIDTTDENGQVFCALSIENVTGEDSMVTVYFNGTKDGYNKGYYIKVITIKAWKEPIVEKTMNITTNLPDTMDSEQLLSMFVTVTDGNAISGVDITLQTTGPGNTCKSTGITDDDGKVSCAMTIHTVTGENSVVILYINGTKEGYQNSFYMKEITVIGYVPPEPIIELVPINVNLNNGASAIVTAGIQGNVTIEVKETVNPDPQDPEALDSLGIFLEITQAGEGNLKWMHIRINYDLVPAGIDPAELKMYYWDNSAQEWIHITNSGVNPTEKYVWANVTHLTIFTSRVDVGDETPPKITHNQIGEGDEGEKILIKAAITDVGDGVQQVILYYREVGVATYETLTMTRVGESFEGTIAESEVGGKDIEYYIEATDGTNTATHPADKATPHTIKINADGGDDSPGFGILLVLGAVCIAGIGIWRKRR